MNLQKRRLLALIDFAQESMRTRARTVTNVADHGSFVLFDYQARDLEGARLNAAPGEGEEEIWLSVAPAPSPEMPPQPESPWLGPWLNVGAAMLAPPGLADRVPGAALIEAGTHRDPRAPASEFAIAVDPGVDPGATVRFEDYPFRSEVERQHALYIESAWKPWAERERRRRRLSQLHARLFTLQQQLAGTLTESQIELVWGMGVAVREQDGATFAHPLITRLVDVRFDPETRAAEVCPRDLDPRLELEIFVSDPAVLAEAEKAAAQYLASHSAPVSPFDPQSCAPLIEIARRCLESASGGTQWRISEGWVLFARPRSAGPVVHDLERLRQALLEFPDDVPLPPAVAALVTEPPEHAPPYELPAFRGLSSRGVSAERPARDLFFPKPFNDEQARIAQLLEVADGVVVQGPPGTGKTHTIANVICHWLAHGRSVLVTSMRDPALAALRDHLPADIRPLALPVLASEQEGLEAFEGAIERIASELQSLDRAALAEEIARLEQTIDALQTRLARIDVDLGRWARLNLSRIDLQGETIDPQDAAAEVIAHAGQYDWIPDPLGVGPQYAPCFTTEDIARLRDARARLGRDVQYANCSLPALADLPDAVRLAQAHRELQRYARLSAPARASALPWPADSSPEILGAAREVAAELARLGALREDIGALRLPWSEEVLARIRRGEPAQAFETLDALGRELEQLAAQRAQFLARPVSVPDTALTDAEFLGALDKLARGKRPFGLSGMFGKGEARKLLDAVRVGGLPPLDAQDWQHVSAFVSMQRKRRELTTRWNAVAPETGMQPVLAADAKGRLSAEAQFALYARVRELARARRALRERAAKLFPGWTPASQDEEAALDELREALEQHLQRQRLGEVARIVEQARAALQGRSGPVVEAMREFLSSRLGHPALDEAELLSEWSRHVCTLERLHAAAEALRTVALVTALIAESGAPALAQRLLEPDESATDRLLPPTFLRDWRLRRLATHLSAIDSQDELKRLCALRAGLEHDLARAYEGLVVKRTWFNLAQNMTPSVRAALQAYLNAVQRIGKGTGKRAYRYRQDARYAAAEAYRAVPCWIMPHYRVCESLPALPGCFDLVVIDEASQSDLSALPVLLRGRRLLIVGDDRQVSPQAIGIEEERIKALMQRHLAEQPALYRAQLSPDRSIYDLAKVVFARSGVMLKEHFRCVAPIIEYSKREFYNHDLRPLRLPRASERLDPPLLDILVSNGWRENGVNPAEAEYIVGEIRRIAGDPRLRGRSIGVVSLLGEEQALRIWDRVLEELGPDGVRRHQIACGDARMFQGRERHIMFLSMVAAPNDIGAPLAREAFAQRFNVAASRARDQMVLVRSVEPDQLSEADKLRRSLIQHFARPFGDDPPRVGDARDLCESALEREIYDWLTAKGYRVMPQVRVGSYRIDLVVEGGGDSRLAIECDGDKYQGPQQWTEDVRRQRALERAGWVFWRCFAASFLRRRAAVLEDLRQALAAQGIEPVHSGGWARRRIAETRRVYVPLPDEPLRSAPLQSAPLHSASL
ncbi:MAG TPA: AAA domain-containing protein [Burkholderiales bacterium]|nr:AAA domain-containing protein [Burkholderiales bacterium]